MVLLFQSSGSKKKNIRKKEIKFKRGSKKPYFLNSVRKMPSLTCECDAKNEAE